MGSVEWRHRRASAGGVRRRVGQHREHEGLGVPERVPVVTRPGQAFGGDRPPLGPRGGLQHVEEPEPHGLLNLVVALDHDVGALPELVEVTPLVGHEALPAGGPGRDQGRVDLRLHRGQRALARPAVDEVLHDAQRLARIEGRGERDAGQVVVAPRLHQGALGPVDEVVHAGTHPQRAVAGAMQQHRPHVVGSVQFADERRLQHGRRPGIAGHRGQRLVGDQVGLEHYLGRARRRGAPRIRSRPPSGG